MAPTRSKPEVLAPAGDEEALRAALSAGADSVYFGLREGFNARARAGNFSFENLAATVARIHRSGAKAYLALNTLVFEAELGFVERVVQRAAQCGVDALIVQDPAVALLARAVCPALQVHASTQMTISSAEGARFARSLGATRVVVPRELSVAEIRNLRDSTELELEVFIHGALCVSWSGQCLTSEAWGGRSANRGECAQSCRMPYELVLDGRVRELGDVRYLLSPKDLAGLRAVESLAEIGVHGLKIEGRQKNAQYVWTATRLYRGWVDALERGDPNPETACRDLLRASLTYTRGFGDGFLGGSDHQALVEGRFPKHRGVYLGQVARIDASSVWIERDPAGRPWTGALAAEARAGGPQGTPSSALRGFDGSETASDGPRASEIELRAGMGVVFDGGHPEDKHEPGGPIFRVESDSDGWRLHFGTPGPDLRRVRVGDLAWVSGDPSLARETERELAAQEPAGRVALELELTGQVGQVLRVVARAGHASAELVSESRLTAASGAGLVDSLLREKLASFGGTPLRLVSFDRTRLARDVHLPVSELKALRRELVAALIPQIERGPTREVAARSCVGELRERARERAGERRPPAREPRLVVLCRSDEQLEAAIDASITDVELDWMELVGLARARERARQAGLAVTLATLRVQKPGEEPHDQRLATLEPEGVLVRHWGALEYFQAPAGSGVRPLLHGDFSLNVTNSVTAAELFARGLETVTAAHDLDESQLFGLLDASLPERTTIVLHHRIATFHTEHCVYAHLLSRGRDFRTCGRPCEAHRVALRDHKGHEHPVIVDVACRNTVFNASAQTSAALVPELLRRGVRRFRVELVREGREETSRILAAYGALLAGAISPEVAARRAGARAHYGVSSAPMSVMS
ncbi:MAG: U32 family peptidase [Planctomycetes bacterium]|nr:U32 family peptidase [Planctomycetota bacterium]